MASRRRLLPNILVVLVLGVIAAVAYTFLKDMDGPTVTISPDNGRMSQNTALSVQVSDPSGIRELNVGIRKNNVFTSFFRKHYDGDRTSITENISIRGAKLSEGIFARATRRRTYARCATTPLPRALPCAQGLPMSGRADPLPCATLLTRT